MSDREGMRWYAVRTQPRKEDFALANLRRQSFRTYCPRMQRITRHARRTTLKRVPLFTGYVFVEVDHAIGGWRSINGTFGVLHLVGGRSHPSPLPDGLVERMIALSDDEDVVGFDDALGIGDKARVVGGAFDTFIGTVIRLGEQDRVTLLLKAMSHEIPVTLERSQLVPVEN